MFQRVRDCLLSVVCCVFFSSASSLELDAPLPKEEGSWKYAVTLGTNEVTRNENEHSLSALKVVTLAEDQSPEIQIGYPFHLPKVETKRDLRKMWNFALIQRMTTQKFITHQTPVESTECCTFLLPEKAVVYRTKPSGIKEFLQIMQEVKLVGFTIEELTEAKEFFLAKMREMQLEHSYRPAAMVAPFHAEGFLRNLGLVSYAYYLDSAPELIRSITPIDIAIALNECFDEDQRILTLFAPLSQRENFEMLVHREIEQISATGIVDSSPSQENVSPYFKLPLNDVDKDLIYNIIDTMARENVIKLGFKRKSMERKGQKIRHVHPLRFLGHIFTNRHLRQCMREVSRSSFKWNGFIDGLSDRINEEVAKDNVMLYVHGFAQHVHMNEQKITGYVERRDWEGLVRFLL